MAATRSDYFSATSDHVGFLVGEKQVPTGDVRPGDYLALASSPEPTHATQMSRGEAWPARALTGDGLDITANGTSGSPGTTSTLLDVGVTGLAASQVEAPPAGRETSGFGGEAPSRR